VSSTKDTPPPGTAIVAYENSTSRTSLFVPTYSLHVQCTNISVQELTAQYSPPDVSLLIVFEHVMDDVYDPKDWAEEAIIVWPHSLQSERRRELF